jgi:parallel beta-helix repeat protein
MVVNGNVDGFLITNNNVHDNDNIAIDAIGHEGISPDPAFDQARNGVIRGNRTYNIDSSTNPAYDGFPGANGIYVDGGRNIVIERNIVHHNNIGIEVASEHTGKSSSGITVRNNLVYRNDIHGITLGGFDRLRGFISNVLIVNNTLFENDRLRFGNGEITLQFDVRNTVIKNNIVRANTQGWLISNQFVENTGSMVDYNLFFVPPGRTPLWQWKKVEYRSLAAWQAATRNDAHSRYADPRLVSVVTPNLHLRATSPAIDRGQLLAAAGSRDIDGQPRRRGLRIDIGADEYWPPAAQAAAPWP